MIVISKKHMLWSILIVATIIFSTFLIYKASHRTYVDTEILNIYKGQVTEVLVPSKITQNDVKAYLHDITGVCLKADPLPDKGYIVKINLKQGIKTDNRWLNNFVIKSVENLFIIFPDKEKPFLLILDEAQRPYFFEFDSNTEKLRKIIESQ